MEVSDFKNIVNANLRDMFAAAALQGFISCSKGPLWAGRDIEVISYAAYAYADAMMKSRESK